MADFIGPTSERRDLIPRRRFSTVEAPQELAGTVQRAGVQPHPE